MVSLPCLTLYGCCFKLVIRVLLVSYMYRRLTYYAVNYFFAFHGEFGVYWGPYTPVWIEQKLLRFKGLMID